MFYETSKNDHGLPRCPFKAIVSPRPVGWVTSMSAKGEINLAPYSFFNAVSDDPPIVMFSSDGYKDSLTFVAETKEFVCNLATFDLRTAVVATSASFRAASTRWRRRGSRRRRRGSFVRRGWRRRPPRSNASSCRSSRSTISRASRCDRHVVFGQVVGVHIDDRFIKNGRLDTAAVQPIARCGYSDYAVVDKVFAVARPKNSDGDPGDKQQAAE